MSDDQNWPFSGKSKVIGMRLPEYLEWASGESANKFEKRLLLPPIQRGFVWKPLQIVQLWDSLLRGMPIGSLTVSGLNKGDKGTEVRVNDRKLAETVDTKSIGLLDGQQRTLAMLLGWVDDEAQKNNHCM